MAQHSNTMSTQDDGGGMSASGGERSMPELENELDELRMEMYYKDDLLQQSLEENKQQRTMMDSLTQMMAILEKLLEEKGLGKDKEASSLGQKANCEVHKPTEANLNSSLIKTSTPIRSSVTGNQTWTTLKGEGLICAEEGTPSASSERGEDSVKSKGSKDTETKQTDSQVSKETVIASKEKEVTGKEPPSQESQRGKTQRPKIIPDRFNGKQPWIDYREHFASCKLANGWSDEEAAIFLAASLQGTALKVLVNGQDNGQRQQYKYRELLKLLNARFGPGEMAENFLLELRNRQQGPKETIQELGQSIRELAALAYPEFEDAGRDRLARGHFADAVASQSIREGIFRANPKTLEEAIKAALATENFEKIEEQRGNKKTDKRCRMGNEQDDLINTVVAEVTQNLKQYHQDLIDKRKSDGNREVEPAEKRRDTRIYYPHPQRRPVSQEGCFNCKQKGHFKRECPYGTRKERSENDRQPLLRPEGRLPRQEGQDQAQASEKNEPQSESVRDNRTTAILSKQGFYVKGSVRTVTIPFLVDTGTTDTIISEEVFFKIPRESRPELEQDGVRVVQADGTVMKTRGVAHLDLKVGHTTCPVRAVIANVKVEGILGMDFLSVTGGTLNFRTCELMLHGERIRCTTRYGTVIQIRVLVRNTTTIPPGHEAIIQGTVTKDEGTTGLGMLEPVSGGGELEQKGLILARSVVQTTEGVLPLRVLNVGAGKCTVREGTMVGYLSPIETKDIVEATGVTPRSEGTDVHVPEHLQDLWKRSVESVGPEYHYAIAQMLVDFADVFSAGDHDLGKTNLVKHHIDTGGVRPIKERPRRQPAIHQQEIDRQVEDLLARGIIEPSDGPWASNVVLVKKKDGTQRFCVDYRRLNEATIKDAYPVPRIDDTLDALSGARWFSTLDLASGYWQVELDESARHKSAFVVRGGLYSWKVMPFGLCNAPATFERLMERVVTGLQWETLLVYLDDVIVYGRSVLEEIQRLKEVLKRFREAGLKLKPSKCFLFKQSVGYLGHVVSRKGIATDPDKIEAVKSWPSPTNIKEVRSFLGLASYYRRYIKGFADVARPLHRLTEKARAFLWDEECEDAFQTLKDKLQQAPILAYPNPEGDFLLDTDASGDGIGAVLSQIQEGEERVIAYASRTLSRPERNYCVTRRELLAVVVYLKYYKQYLYGRRITIRTDHAALRWLLNFKNPEGQVARWLEVIGGYDYTIVHRPGKKHGNADGLSRKPCGQCGHSDDVPSDLEAKTPMEDSNESETRQGEEGTVTRVVKMDANISNEDIRQAQLADASIAPVMSAKEGTGVKPSWVEASPRSAAAKVYWAQWDRLEVREGILCRRWESHDGKTISWQVILPSEFRKEIIGELHGGVAGGHFGVTRTLASVKARYYWAFMARDVRASCRQCTRCAQRKSPPRKRRAPLQQYQVGAPMERVALDLVGPLPESDRGNKWILVIGEYFTKWMEAYPLPDSTSATVAKAFVEKFVCRFGVPRELHSDQGRNFEADIFTEMCKVLGINKTRTVAYNPKSDGMVERFNRTLINSVSTMIDPHRNQKDWDDQLAFATFAYRTVPQASTGETPNMLMLGREVLLPVDLTTASPAVEGTEPQTDFALELRTRMQDAHDRARLHLRRSARHQKKTYDRGTNNACFKEGQFAWLYNHAKKKGVSPKLMSRWQGPYLILDKLSNVTYRIQLKPRGRMQVVHFDRLKPYDGEPLQPWTGRKQTAHRAAECEVPPVEATPELSDGTGFEGGYASLGLNEENPEDTNERSDGSNDNEGTGRRNPVRKRQMPHRYR